MSLGVGINNVNDDGWEDVYVANDFIAQDYLYVNNGDGTFRERGSDWLEHYSYATIGTDLGDVNSDGRVDIITADSSFLKVQLSGSDVNTRGLGADLHLYL